MCGYGLIDWTALDRWKCVGLINFMFPCIIQNYFLLNDQMTLKYFQ